ncbi:Flp pilus assembly protein CpaB [Lysobacter pythonis]|uniref:Flp pilus assembly protein CpaB n=1 Tax=Solilutibacter pythonis TaxID=2483112 RepID=A0A3M2I0Y7_9GAMM|nr:Flp pilus assembly protein CpaB [Lysobacter pythonis]RMH93823.1 Flp pilus assembly protein CpaB [Lysobacter pythonis]
MQKPKLNKNFMYIGAAGLLALMASGIAVKYVQTTVAEKTRDDREMVEVAVANNDLTQGAILSPEDLSSRSVPADFVPADAVTPENYEEYTGRMLRSPVRGGAPLSASALVPLYDQFSRIIPKGKVAYNLSVDENNSISGMISPGDMIDIFFLKDMDEAKGGPRLFPLLQQIKVLATGTQVGEKIHPPGEENEANDAYSSLTLELDQHQAKQLAVANRSGNLRVLLREITDTSPGTANGLSERELLHSLSGMQSTRRNQGIEFIIGGRS